MVCKGTSHCTCRRNRKTLARVINVVRSVLHLRETPLGEDSNRDTKEITSEVCSQSGDREKHNVRQSPQEERGSKKTGLLVALLQNGCFMGESLIATMPPEHALFVEVNPMNEGATCPATCCLP